MNQRHVLIMALCTGAVLAFFSLGFHHCAMTATEAELRVACRAICSVSTRTDSTTTVPGDMGQLAEGFRGVACSAMSDEAPQLLQCRDTLTAREISVADYHCLRDATTLAEARDCDVF